MEHHGVVEGQPAGPVVDESVRVEVGDAVGQNGDPRLDPAKPEMVLLAMDGGNSIPPDELGGCNGGTWTGSPDMQVVGAVFINLASRRGYTLIIVFLTGLTGFAGF